MTAAGADDLAILSRALPGLDFSDTARREFLAGADGRDIQAAPGSGKTTLLVARLCLLAERWTEARRGICVLSHTNVARGEVHHRLADQPRGQALLGHPHFIGTLTAFIHQFMAMPLLRGFGIGVKVVDDDAFMAEVLREMWRNPAIRAWASRQRDPEAIARSLAFNPATMRIADDGSLPGPGKVRSGLERIRERLTARGMFMYSDMIAVAKLAMERRPSLPDRLSQRFPVVFVDEAQDTSPEHEAIIRAAFAKTAAQWIGDCNQNIYGGDGHSWTPADGYLDLGGSKRFGLRTATFASKLTMARAQDIKGVDGRDTLHSIFLFDEDTIEQVVSAYCASLAAAGGFDEASEVWAVAARHKVPDQARQSWPNCIGDYWPEYAHPKPQGERAGTLLGVLLDARARTGVSGSPQEALSMFGSALFRFLDAWGGWTPDVRSQVAQWQSLEAAVPGSRLAMRGLLKSALTTGIPDDEDRWRLFIGPLADVAEALTGVRPEFEGFLAFEGLVPGGGEGRNLHVWESADARIALKFGTIHSVKGQTNDATLVLETNEGRKMDVAEAVSVAFGGSRPTGKQVTKALMNVFVGATRPRRALCLATRRAAVSPELERAIAAAGWIVHDLTAGR